MSLPAQQTKPDMGMLYYKNLMVNKQRNETINFNPLSKDDYEMFKEAAFTNSRHKLTTNDSDDYSNFRIKLYSRDTTDAKESSQSEWIQMESLGDELIHDAIDYAIKNYYYSKNI